MLSLRLRRRLIKHAQIYKQHLNYSSPQAILHSCTSSLSPRLCKNIACSTFADTCKHTPKQRKTTMWPGQPSHCMALYKTSAGTGTPQKDPLLTTSAFTNGAWFVCSRGQSGPVCVAFCTSDNCSLHLAYYCFSTTDSSPIRRERRCVCVSGRACVCVCLKGNYLKTWPPPTNRIDMHHFAVRAHRRQTDLEGSSDTSTI